MNKYRVKYKYWRESSRIWEGPYERIVEANNRHDAESVFFKNISNRDMYNTDILSIEYIDKNDFLHKY